MAMWPAGTDIEEVRMVAANHNIVLSRPFLYARITIADFQTWQGCPGVRSQKHSCFGVRLQGVASLLPGSTAWIPSPAWTPSSQPTPVWRFGLFIGSHSAGVPGPDPFPRSNCGNSHSPRRRRSA
jgi:hypothetical protein